VSDFGLPLFTANSERVVHCVVHQICVFQQQQQNMMDGEQVTDTVFGASIPVE